jgi:ABC-type lipoprotein export system ATPase subunit
MAIVELRDYAHAPTGRGKGLETFSFALEPGDVCRLHSDRIDDAHLFLRALATLEPPEKGAYLFRGEVQNFSNPRTLYPVRRRIAYLGVDAALIGNRSLKTNLLMARYYYENNLHLELGGDVLELCRTLGIEDKLHLRPAQVAAEDARAAVIIREVTKEADVFLVEQSFVALSRPTVEKFSAMVRKVVDSGVPCVFYSEMPEFGQFRKKDIFIRDGIVQVQ